MSWLERLLGGALSGHHGGARRGHHGRGHEALPMPPAQAGALTCSACNAALAAGARCCQQCGVGRGGAGRLQHLRTVARRRREVLPSVRRGPALSMRASSLVLRDPCCA